MPDRPAPLLQGTESVPASATPQEAEAILKRRLLNPLAFRAYLWKNLPLAAVAGLRLDAFDEGSCTVSLPGGFRTRNPFRSTYFAAQAMAAEMSTGIPALILTKASPHSIALTVREVRGVFVKRLQGRGRFIFEHVAEMRRAVEEAGEQASTYVALSRGVDASENVASEFTITWSFKKRA
jgi:hypothetical protein